jgi:hypothetical protein
VPPADRASYEQLIMRLRPRAGRTPWPHRGVEDMSLSNIAPPLPGCRAGRRASKPTAARERRKEQHTTGAPLAAVR